MLAKLQLYQILTSCSTVVHQLLRMLPRQLPFPFFTCGSWTITISTSVHFCSVILYTIHFYIMAAHGRGQTPQFLKCYEQIENFLYLNSRAAVQCLQHRFALYKNSNNQKLENSFILREIHSPLSIEYLFHFKIINSRKTLV